MLEYCLHTYVNGVCTGCKKVVTMDTFTKPVPPIDKLKDDYLGLAHEAGWYDPKELVIPYSVLEEALTAHTNTKNKAEVLAEQVTEQFEKAFAGEKLRMGQPVYKGEDGKFYPVIHQNHIEEIVSGLLKEAINDFDMAKASAGREVSFSYWFREEVTKALISWGDQRAEEGAKAERERIQKLATGTDMRGRKWIDLADITPPNTTES